MSTVKKVDYGSKRVLDAAWRNFIANLPRNGTLYKAIGYRAEVYGSVDRRSRVSKSFERMLKTHGVEVYELYLGTRVNRLMKYGEDFDMPLFILRYT